MKIFAVLFVFSLNAFAQQPNLREQVRLFQDVSDTTFEVPTERSAPGFEDGCWSQDSLWKRIGMFQKRENTNWQDQGPGLLKFIVFYERKDEERCANTPSRFAAFEQTFHLDGIYQNVWRLEGVPSNGQTFTFHSSFQFRGHEKTNFYREQCRFFQRTRDEKYLVCRVINQDGEGNPGFLGLLTYEFVPNRPE